MTSTILFWPQWSMASIILIYGFDHIISTNSQVTRLPREYMCERAYVHVCDFNYSPSYVTLCYVSHISMGGKALPCKLLSHHLTKQYEIKQCMFWNFRNKYVFTLTSLILTWSFRKHCSFISPCTNVQSFFSFQSRTLIVVIFFNHMFISGPCFSDQYTTFVEVHGSTDLLDFSQG